MNGNQTSETQALALTGASSMGLVLNIDIMDKAYRLAELMANGKATVPKHLQGSPADCMAVTLQALQWNMSPFAVAQKTHLVNGTLGYEAQLVNAVLQSTGAIDGDFQYEFKGVVNDLECRVGAIPRGKAVITWGEWLSIKDVTTKNSPLWKTNPKQQMGYLQVKNWARLYKPGAILGVYTADELEQVPPKHMGAAEVVTGATPAEKAELAEWPDEALERRFTKYRKALADGHTHDELIASAEKSGRLTDAQKKRIQELKPIEQEKAKADPDISDATPKTTYADVASKLHAAKSMEALDDAGTLIGAVSDPEQRRELTAIYDQRSTELKA